MFDANIAPKPVKSPNSLHHLGWIALIFGLTAFMIGASTDMEIITPRQHNPMWAVTLWTSIASLVVATVAALMGRNRGTLIAVLIAVVLTLCGAGFAAQSYYGWYPAENVDDRM